MKRAVIYERKDEWYMLPSSRTTNGLWIETTPTIRLSRQDSRQHKGEAAIEALGASQDSVPIPTYSNALVAPLLAMANVRSWPAFMKRASCVALEHEHGQLKIIPQKKLVRPKGALESLPEKAIDLSEGATSEEIGAALEEAMSLCQ